MPRRLLAGYKGESFDLWAPDLGPTTLGATPRLSFRGYKPRARGKGLKNSVFFEVMRTGAMTRRPCLATHRALLFGMSPERPIHERFGAHSCCRTGLANQGPHFVFPCGESPDAAYPLGVLSSSRSIGMLDGSSTNTSIFSY